MATHSSILAWRIPMDRGAQQAAVHGVARVGHNLATKPPPCDSGQCKVQEDHIEDLIGYSPWGRKESDTTERLHFTSLIGRQHRKQTYFSFREVKKSLQAECQRIDAFELQCWRRLLRIPWTARRSNQSILKEISPKYSLEGLMWKLKLQYCGHLM